MNDRLPEIGPHGFFTHENESIYYESYGAGETVILCHGLGGNHAIWYQQVPMLARLFHVVTWDQRGFGRSTNRTQQSGPAAAVKDLKALTDHLNIDRTHIIGQSMGGWAALGFAIAHPKQTRSLVLADTIAGIFTPRIAAAYDAARKKRPSPEQLEFGQHPAIGNQLTRHNPTQSFLYNQIGSVAEPPPADMRERLRNTAYTLTTVGSLSIPTLFIVGGNDPIFFPATIREAAGHLQRTRVVDIPDTGHSPYFELPEVWNRIVLEFLQDL